ncbi:MAG: hypothetical protein IPL83_16250 [Bdellovibrionales bacterium]|nr:hypothetical protein [Bdellovibrionales bacterium]
MNFYWILTFLEGARESGSRALGPFAMFIRQVDGEMKGGYRGKWFGSPGLCQGKQEQEVVRLMEDLKQKRKSGVYFLPLSERSGAL